MTRSRFVHSLGDSLSSHSPVGGPAAWRGEDIGSDEDWVVRPTVDELGDVVDAARRIAASVRAGERSLVDIGRADIGVAAVVELVERVRRSLDVRGFALVRSLPVDVLDDVEHRALSWVLGIHVGDPLPQNAAGDVLVRVRSEGQDFARPGVRAYETTAELEFHTDSSDVVALHCLRPARRGGTSTIASSATVHDEMVRCRPDLAALLYAPWPSVNPVDGVVSHGPICARNGAGALFTRYGRKYTDLAPAAGADPLTPEQVAALDLYDEITRRPGLALDMDFRPGDVQFLDNHRILHARTAYEDWPEPHRRRELVRMWLVRREELDLPAAFHDAGFVRRSLAIDVA